MPLNTTFVFNSYKFALVIVVCLLFAGCASNNRANLGELSEKALFDKSQDYLKNEIWTLAIEALRRLESDFPFGQYSQPAQLSLIYAYYRSDEMELADASAARFIRLHPQHKDIDYAIYLRGLAAFPDFANFFQSVLGSDLSRKSMADAERSIQHFTRLTRNFPNSLYAQDSLQRMIYLRNLMARHEVNVGNFYLDYKAYPAAIGRAQYVLENFQESPAMADALAILIQSYHGLKLENSVASYLETLRLNYPDYPAIDSEGNFDFDYLGKQNFSVTRYLTFGLIDGKGLPGFYTEPSYD